MRILFSTTLILFFQFSPSLTCESNEYKATNGTCVQCFPSCASCMGPGNQNCTSCIDRYFYINKTNSCFSNCDYAGMFYDPLHDDCIGCHPACKGCTGPTSEDCKECSRGYLRIGSKHGCDLSCPLDHYLSKNGTNCL